MIDSITRITLNLQETNTMVSIRAKRGDTGRKLLIHLSDGSIPYHISDDCYATFTAKKPDGTKINNACTIGNNVIEYEFTDQTCTAVGTMKAEIRLYGADGKMITSACFLINVYDTVFHDGDEVSSEGEMNTLDDLILQVNKLMNETGKNLRWQGNWDSDAEYEANDMVLHQKALYVAEAAVTAGVKPGSEESAWIMIAGMGTGNGGSVDLTGYATEQYVKQYAQPKGDYLKSTELSDAINTALAQAKESGQFDGKNGYTPVKGKDYFDGVSPTVAVSKTGKITTITITDVNGTKTATIHDGEAGTSSGGNTVPIYYTSKEPSDDMNLFLFDYSEIETNGRTISAGDWIVTPSGRVYVVDIAEDYGIDATYDASLSVDSSDPDNVDLGITGATVGQIAKIIAVDEEGRPTAWESVNLPDSGDMVEVLKLTAESTGVFSPSADIENLKATYADGNSVTLIDDAITFAESGRYKVETEMTITNEYACYDVNLRLSSSSGKISHEFTATQGTAKYAFEDYITVDAQHAERLSLEDLSSEYSEKVAAVIIHVSKMVKFSGYVKSVNGVVPDANGNVEITVPDSGGNVDLTGYATEKWVQEQKYLSEVPEGYAKDEDIPTKPEDIGAQPSGNYLTEVPSGYATEEFVKNKIAEAELGGEEVDLSGYAQKSELPTKVSQLQNDSGYLTAVPVGYAKTEDIPKNPTDIGAQPEGDYALRSEIPSVPVKSVNGKTGAVSLTATDVKARPDSWMPTAQEVGALPNTYTPPNQTAEQVGADPKGTAASAVSQHNTADDSHNDIRLELKAINDRLTAFFDSDNQTLDELSEIVAYITSNKSLIDSITASKVNVADIINNLTTNVSSKPLSAAQGVVLKGLIDTVSNSLSNYQPKGNYLTEIPVVSVAKGGTGATDAATARSNLGITPANIGAAASSHNHSASNISSGTLSSSRLPTVPVTKGGTGATDAATARNNLEITPANIGAFATDSIITFYNVSLSVTDGVGNYSNSNIKASSRCFVQRRVGSFMSGIQMVAGTTSQNGYVTVAFDTNFDSNVNINLIVINS